MNYSLRNKNEKRVRCTNYKKQQRVAYIDNDKIAPKNINALTRTRPKRMLFPVQVYNIGDKRESKKAATHRERAERRGGKGGGRSGGL